VRTLAAVALLVACTAGAAHAVTVNATIDPAKLSVGQSAQLAVRVEGTQSAPAPQIANTAGVTISYLGPATQMSFVNGKVSSSITHNFNVVATKPGRHSIGPIAVDADGQRYDAGSVTLEVLAAAASAPDAAAPADDQLTLLLQLPKTDVYVRERIPVSLQLQVGAVRVSDLQYPQIPGDGFSLDKFPEPAQYRDPKTNRYLVDFKTTLTPLRQGTLTVGPATMGMGLVVQNRRNRGFFSGFFDETRPVQIQSDPITLTVLPLPTDGRPADFTGAVGQFGFEVSAAPLDVAAGDPVTVKSIVRGDGSLDGVAPPALPGSGTLRVYPPQTSQGGDGARERVFEQVVIPMRDGAVTLPPLRWNYFDPAKRRYQTITPPPIALTVRPSASVNAAPEIVGARPGTPVEPTRPETLGRDIVFIKDAPGTLRAIGSRPYHAPLWWLVQLLPVAAFAGASAWARQRRRLTGDVRYARFTRAGREARTAIAGARDTLARGDVSAAHDAVAGALRDYLTAKLDLPPGTIAETAPAALRAARVDGAVADQVVEFFAGCEAARFAPGGASRRHLDQALTHADAIVQTLERARGLAPARALVAALAMFAAGAFAAGGEGPSALFIRANGLYGDSKYAEAAAAYEQILAQGIESGAVQYNLGNAYLKAGDVGRAVLAYERARRLVPGDPDLAANLGFARESARDVSEPPLLARIAFPLAERLSTTTLATGAAIAWWLLWLSLGVGALVPVAGAASRGLAVASGLAFALVASSGAWRWWTLEHPTTAVVVAHDDVTVRSEPTPTATALFVATPGTVLHVERTREDAALVTSRDGRRGWLTASALATL
jgi:tetratricopeptide (TPR) repeat protein